MTESPQVYRIIPRAESSVIKAPRRLTADLENGTIQIIRRSRPHITWGLAASARAIATLDIHLSHDRFWFDRKSSLYRDVYAWNGEPLRGENEGEHIPDPVQIDHAISFLRQELNAFDLISNITQKSSLALSLQFKEKRLFTSEIRRMRRAV